MFHLIMTWSNGKLQGPWPCRGILTFTVPYFSVGIRIAGTRTAGLTGGTFLLLPISTVALDMGCPRLACSTAMLTLRGWAAFPVDVDQGAICPQSDCFVSRRTPRVHTAVLAAAHAMTTNTSFAGPLLAIDQHLRGLLASSMRLSAK